jgi:hypothetical protein
MDIIHTLREKMLTMRTEQILKDHPNYNFSEDQQIPINPNLLKEYKAPYDINVFSGRIKRNIRVKALKKGKELKALDGEQGINLQKAGNEYLELDDLWGKLKEHDADDKVIKKTWGQFTDDEKADKLEEFADNFKNKGCNDSVIQRLKKDVLDKFENCFFDENKYIVWNKNCQKIYEIKHLFIGKDDYNWE